MRAHYIAGFLDSGIQPRGTPITAETVHGSEFRLNVAWRDERGRILSATLSRLSGWRLHLSNSAVKEEETVSMQRGDGRD